MSELIRIEHLTKHFAVRSGLLHRSAKVVHAVDDVSLRIMRGQTFGLVGESGCGKSTLGRLVLRLIMPTAGSVYFEGRNLLGLTKKELRNLRRDMQIVFQDPFGSLNPRFTVERIIGEPMKVHGTAKGSEMKSYILQLLEKVGLKPEHARLYPHMFSGGQRQRIAIARALATSPKFMVLDEPTSALDVSVQARILNLLQDLRREFSMTYLFISHNLSVIDHAANRVGVMYLGKIVESADARDLFASPRHPYTESLISAVPVPDPDAIFEGGAVKGDVASAVDPPRGCRFNTRCPHKQDMCVEEDPELVEIDKGHLVACHLVREARQD
jgi:oligopeptide transport system ATP-binding protein